MGILLCRHADAVAESSEIRESHRFLTAAGRRDAIALGELLRAQGVVVDGVVTSPLMRAVQTAELVAAALGFGGTVEALPALAPGGDAHAAADAFARWPGRLLAIGHEPSLSAIGALLCRRPFHPVHKAQAYLIEEGRPVWSLRPGDAAPQPVA